MEEHLRRGDVEQEPFSRSEPTMPWQHSRFWVTLIFLVVPS